MVRLVSAGIIAVGVGIVTGMWLMLSLPGPATANNSERDLRWAFLRECALRAVGTVEHPDEYCARVWIGLVVALDQPHEQKP